MPLQLPANIGSGGSGGSGGSVTATDALLVAAADAPATVRASANYVCDGVDDQVEISQALLGANAQNYTLATETFPGNSGNMSGTIFGTDSSTMNGTWGVFSGKCKVSTGIYGTEDGTRICRMGLGPSLHAAYKFVPGFEYACDVTYQAGTLGILFEYNYLDPNLINGVAFLIDGTNAKIVEGSSQTLAASIVYGTTTYPATAGTTMRLSFSYQGANRYVAKINGTVILNATISNPTADILGESGNSTHYTFLTFHSTLSNNTFDNWDYAVSAATGSTTTGLMRPVRLSVGRFNLTAGLGNNDNSLDLSGAGRRQTILDCTGLPANTPVITARGSNPSLRSFCISGRSRDGTVNSANGAGGVSFGNKIACIQNVWFYKLNAVHAISFTDNAGVDVLDCEFDNNGATSVAVYNGMDGMRCICYVVDGCDFIGDGGCVYFAGDSIGVHRITSNRFYGHKGINIYISITGRLGVDAGPVITGNFMAGGGTGIKLENLLGATVTGNVISQNFDGTPAPAHGIHLHKSDQNQITGNTIMWNDSHGIFIEGSSNNTVSGNAIAENGSDATHDNIRIVTSSDATPITSNYNHIDGNTIRRTSPNDANAYYGNTPQYGVRITAGTGNKVTNNDIHQSGFAGDLSDSGTSTITGGNRT